MPRNWLDWILERENKEVIKSCANDKITTCEVTQNQETDKKEKSLIKNDSSVETCNDSNSLNLNPSIGSNSNRNSFISVDSGFYSDVSDLDLSDDIEEEECATIKLRDWLQKIRFKRRPPTLQNDIFEEPIEDLFTKADPYFGEKEVYWAGGFDKEGRYHGKGVVTYSDEGFISGSWRYGTR